MSAIAVNAKRKIVIFVYILAFMASTLGGFTIFDKLIMPGVTRKTRTLVLPNVVGMRYEEATELLKKSGLKPVKIAEEYSSQQPSGAVLWQIPEGGIMVKRGRKIRLAVSLGTEKVIIPNLKGKSYRQGRIDLERMGLIIGKVDYEYSGEVDADNIISTAPAAQTVVNKGDTVNIVVSLGIITGKVVVPSFVGYPVTELLERVKEAGLYADSSCIKIRKIPTVKPGTVFQQSIYPGESVPRGTKIEFIVNEGSPEAE